MLLTTRDAQSPSMSAACFTKVSSAQWLILLSEKTPNFLFRFFIQTNNTFSYLFYVKKHIDALLTLGCHVIMVFDGRPLPAKKDVNDGRKEKRKSNMEAGQRLLAEGKSQEAVAKFQQAVTLTSEIVENTIEMFRWKENVDIIVAPYESDAQLAYLTREGFADAVITEDTDLIAFGCERILFKWVAETGVCQEYKKELLPKCFTGQFAVDFDFVKFRRICILSGCDYLQNGLNGVGLTKAHKFFMKTSRTNLEELLPQIPRYLKDSNLKLPKTFVQDFIRAEKTFLHQVVFDPKERCQKPLTPYPSGVTRSLAEDSDEDEFAKIPGAVCKSKTVFDYAGVVLAQRVSVRLALGNTASEGHINDKFFLPNNIPKWSVWGDSFESGSQKMAKQRESERKKQKSCGVFQLGSPQKKRKRLEEDIVTIEGSPEKKREERSPLLVKRKKKILNEPTFAESPDQLMKMYCPEKFEQKTKENVDPKRAEKISISVKETVNISVVSFQSQEEPVTPTPLATISQPAIGFKKSLGAGKPALGKSPYFSGKSSTLSNPFKRPEIGLNVPTVPVIISPTVEEKPKSLLDDCDEDAEAKKPTLNTIRRFSGFKPAGLRRSMTK